MCFFLSHFPRCRIHTLANSWWESISNCGTKGDNSLGFKLLCSSNHENEKKSWKWNRRPISTGTKGRRKNSLSSKTSVRHETFDRTVASSIEVNTNKTKASNLGRIQYHDIQQSTTDIRELAELLTIIVFDLETTGLSRRLERIIEIALQDLAGGKNSTFHSLINPECLVPNQHVHGISTNMVNRSDVPSMKQFIPILLEYIESRQKPGGHVLWVAHNARTFDVPFLLHEFDRCSFKVPQNWCFLDAMTLGREVMKSGGPNLPPKLTLQALREHYGIPLVGSAHRAMSDVNTLSLILQRMTFDLKIPISGLLERSFRSDDLAKSKKKKS